MNKFIEKKITEDSNSNRATKLSAEEFVELLIEIDALQRLFQAWTNGEEAECAQEQSIRVDVLEMMLIKKIALRDEALAEFRMVYPEMKQFAWATPEFDA